MPYAFENMTDYINMFCVVIVNDLFQEFSDLSNEETICNVHCAPEYLISDLNQGLGAQWTVISISWVVQGKSRFAGDIMSEVL